MSATTISCLQTPSKHNIGFGYLSSASKLICKLDNVNKCKITDSSSSLSMQAISIKIKDTSSSLSSDTFGGTDYNMLLSEVLVGRMVSDYVFRQSFKIRSRETGPSRITSIEALMNFFQETGVNHLKTIGLLSDDMNSTPKMSTHNLVWVVTKLQVEVDRYPTCDDIVQIDHWKSFFGKNNGCGTWSFRDYQSGEILVRASSNWIMMNKETRRLSKFPDDVRAELTPYFVDTPSPIQENIRKYTKIDENDIVHVRNGLTATRKDLDMNKHVNNVKYIGWILESVPDWIADNYELGSMTLEYRRECTKGSVLQSQTFVSETNDASGTVDCQHLLQFEGGSNGVILKAMTTWRPTC
ncbi:palmitoyl-acyl carrier protein thioesterase, chloroplastic-like [Rutidosis leptorrhynchoides]|uniref:palmitoyl-acyl carrier protein thioesterase, chloroplastic-like n=1 Tax=Rutidosis leptorrhynchoides TaxID=125765 RepID=UPI003A9A44F2